MRRVTESSSAGSSAATSLDSDGIPEAVPSPAATAPLAAAAVTRQTRPLSATTPAAARMPPILPPAAARPPPAPRRRSPPDAAASALPRAQPTEPPTADVLQQLRAQSESRKHADPKMALLGRVLDKCLGAARRDGVSVSTVLDRILCPSRGDAAQDLTGRQAVKPQMRPPRGLELEAAVGARPPRGDAGELVLRILCAHDDGDTAGLTALELLDGEGCR